MTSHRSHFGKALRFARQALGLAQEDFGHISSRTYVSALERGIKQPTLPKVDDLAGVLDIHPLTLVALSYCEKRTEREVGELVMRIQLELAAVVAAHAQSRDAQ